MESQEWHVKSVLSRAKSMQLCKKICKVSMKDSIQEDIQISIPVSMQICKNSRLHWCPAWIWAYEYTSMQVCIQVSTPACKHTFIQVCKHTRKQVGKEGSMLISKFVNIHMLVCKNARRKITLKNLFTLYPVVYLAISCNSLSLL